MLRSLLCAGLFLDAALAVAQPPPIPPRVRAGETVAVPAGRFADVAVDVPAGASVVWRFYPPPVQRANGLPPGRAIFAGEPGKSYVVTAIVVDFKKQSVTDSEFVVEFAGKVVPPDPRPDPKPEPKPDPPEPVSSFKAILVFESGAPLPSAQFGALYGKEVEDYLTARCTGGRAGWDRRDKDTDPAHDTTALKDVWAAGRGKVTAVPAVVFAVNGRVTVEPLPATPAAALALLKKYAGDN